MAQLKAEFRAGQANYNRIVTLHKNIQRLDKEHRALENKLRLARPNENRARERAANHYPNPAMRERMRLLWLVKLRKAQKYRVNVERQLGRVRTNMNRALAEYARLYWGAEPNNVNLERNVRNYVRVHNAPNIRLAKLKLAHAINRRAVLPESWTIKRMFNKPVR
jgi:hypothetical protein